MTIALLIKAIDVATLISTTLPGRIWLTESRLKASHLRNDATRSLWLITSSGLFFLGVVQAAAQSASSGAFTVVEERVKQSNGQITITYQIVPALDTLPPPVRSGGQKPKRAIAPKPAWRSEPPTHDEQEPLSPTNRNTPDGFFIPPVAPNPSVYKTHFWFGQHPY